MFKPEGVYVAMLTPFQEDGSVNEKELRKIVDFQIERGVHGLFPISSVGESVHLSTEDKFKMMDIVVDQAAGRVKVTPGVAATEPKLSLKLIEHARKAGCDAVVAHPPYFYPAEQEIMEKYFEILADEGGLPLILYNIPLFAAPISYDVVKRLARRENVVAMKDSSGSMVDFLHFMDKIAISGADMNCLTGREETLLACLTMGGRGCMTATSGILPEVMRGVWDKFHEGDIAGARELQMTILNPIRAMFAMPFPLGFKAAMEVRGFKMGPPKRPLSDAQQFNYLTIRARIDKVMKPIHDRLEKEWAAKA